MFFIGGLPALLALYVRSQVKESEVWERRKLRSLERVLSRDVGSHWKLFLYLVLLMTMMNFVSHGTQDMYPTFLERDWGFSPQKRALVTMLANVGAIIGGIMFGHYSDSLGRRKTIVLALVLAIVSIPLWAYAPSLPLLVVGAFVMQFMVQGAWGVVPVHINELAPDSVRGFLPGFAYQVRRDVRQRRRVHRGGVRRADDVRERDVVDGGDGVHPRRDRGVVRARAAWSCVRGDVGSFFGRGYSIEWARLRVIGHGIDGVCGTARNKKL